MTKQTKKKDVYNLLFGRISTNIADSLFYMAILWHFKEVSRSPFIVSIIFAVASGIDMISFGFGPLIDRISIKKLLESSTFLQAAISVITFLILYLRIDNLIISIILITLYIASTILSAIIYPAEYKLLPLFVSEKELLRFNGIFQLTYRVLDLLLDAGVTVIITLTSIPITVVLSAIVFAIALKFYGSLKINLAAKEFLEEDEYFTGSYRKDMALGWKTLRKEKNILELILPIAFTNFFYGIFSVGLPYFAQSYIRDSALGYGTLLFMSSLGSIGGTLLVQRFKIGKKDMQIFIAICFLGAGIFRVLVPISIYLNIWVLLVASAISSMWITMMNTNFEALVQTSFSSSILGRVETINDSILSAMIPIGTLVGGWIIKVSGSLMTQYIYGAALLLSAVYYFLILKDKKQKNVSDNEIE